MLMTFGSEGESEYKLMASGINTRLPEERENLLLADLTRDMQRTMKEKCGGDE